MIQSGILQRPGRLARAITLQASRMLAAFRYDLAWRFARPGHFRQRFEQAVTNMSQGICLYDSNDRLQLVNEQFCRIYRQQMSTLWLGMRFRDMLDSSMAAGNYPGRNVDDVWRARKAFIDQRKAGTFLQELGDGRLIAISHQPLNDGGWVATYEDITERRRAELQIKFMAQHDSLTQLPNRVLFGERLDDAILRARGGQPCALLCIDLDGFKQVNDRLGHAAGDLLLQHVAARLQADLRPGDIAARLGGDEFAVLLPDIGTAEAMAVASRIGETLAQEYALEPFGPAWVGASVGVACAPQHADAADTLLSNADKALYVAKHSPMTIPRLYDEQMHETVTPAWFAPSSLGEPVLGHRVRIDEMRAALQAGAMTLHYQPIWDRDRKEPVCFEALLRWHDPIRGAITPAEFIPVAEASGFIVPLSEWVLRTACREALSWDGGASVGVNLSPLNFRQPDLVENIAAILAETGLPPARLVIEITEGLLMDKSHAVGAGIEGLRAMGVDLWLDDFGIGYANFASLHFLPCTAIKIDRSFLAAGAHGTQLLGPMIALGHACGLKVIAEGVETEEQRQSLRALGCDRMQGFLLGRPALGENLEGADGRKVRARR